MLKISQRLLTLAQQVPSGSRVADIGTDHALLPCYLAGCGISSFVVGVELHKGPLIAANHTVQLSGMSQYISIRQGNGLAPLAPGEADVVIIAGMGGDTIREILEQAPKVLEEVKRLVLQPMTGSYHVRSWLFQNGWTIEKEDIIQEEGRIYEIIVAEKGASPVLHEMELSYGPFLIRNKHPLLLGIMEKDIISLQDIIKQLAKSTGKEARRKQLQLAKRIEEIKELIEWLSVAKP